MQVIKIFLNVEYTGLDLNGNRYILKAEEAYLDDVNQELIIMKIVNAIFYFKDNTIYMFGQITVYTIIKLLIWNLKIM